MDVATAVITYLKSLPVITSKVGLYSAQPSIFHVDTVPADMPKTIVAWPYLDVMVITGQNKDDFSKAGFEVQLDIRAFAKVATTVRSIVAVQALADAVLSNINRKRFPIAGGRMLGARALLPAPTPTSGPDVIGRHVTAFITCEEP